MTKKDDEANQKGFVLTLHKEGGKQDPVYVGVGAVHESIALSENLTKKEKQMLQKLEAQVEYEEAHGNDEKADKLRERIVAINDKAKNKEHKETQDDSVQVVHSGRGHHSNLHRREKTN